MWKHNLLAVCALSLLAGSAWGEDSSPLKTDKDKLSYAIGASIGKNLTKDSTQIELPVLIDALKAALAGAKLQMTDKEIRILMNDYERDLRKQAAQRMQKAQVENRARGDAYLTEFKKQAGVHETPGGVLYQVIKEGAGRKPNETDSVQVNYRGTLVDGTEFDATEAGKPADLKVAALISGWKQALTMMNEGAKWHLVIPSQLAYGERGVGSDIGPNEVLVFDVELVAIK